MTTSPVLSVDLLSAVQARPGRLAFLNQEGLRQAVEAYLKFLHLASLFPSKALAPTVAIDEIWHLHMLHPEAYHRDCMEHLGYLMDHDAGFGFTPEERPDLLIAFQKTADLWAATFGESYGAAPASGEDATNCSKKETEPTNCAKKEIEPTNCAKKEIEPTNCSKKETEPTNCAKSHLDAEGFWEGPVSANLVQAALRSEGPLGRLEEEAVKAAFSDYLVFLSDLQRQPRLQPSSASVHAMWELHMLHPVAYRQDCLRVLGYVLDHTCTAPMPVELDQE